MGTDVKRKRACYTGSLRFTTYIKHVSLNSGVEEYHTPVFVAATPANRYD